MYQKNCSRPHGFLHLRVIKPVHGEQYVNNIYRLIRVEYTRLRDWLKRPKYLLQLEPDKMEWFEPNEIEFLPDKGEI